VADRQTGPHVGWKKALLYSLLPVTILLAGLELSARVVEIWIPPWKVDYGWGFTPDSRLFIPSEGEEGVMVTSPAKEVNFHRQRFAVPKPFGTLRIFMLGGSSVNYLQGDLEMLAIRLEEDLAPEGRLEILDAGGLSYGSHRLVPIAAEIMAYEPDLVLVYSGHNEFEEVEQLRLAHLRGVPLQRIVYRSALCRFVRDRMAALQVSALQRRLNRSILSETNPHANLRVAYQHRYTAGEIGLRMEAFRNNLAIIMTLCQTNQVPIVIGTVPSNLMEPSLRSEHIERYKPVWDLFERGAYEQGMVLGREVLSGLDRCQSSGAENGIIRSLAKEFEVPLADVEAAIIETEPHHVPGETLFDDCCHLNEQGRAILIRTYEPHIRALLSARSGAKQ